MSGDPALLESGADEVGEILPGGGEVGVELDEPTEDQHLGSLQLAALGDVETLEDDGTYGEAGQLRVRSSHAERHSPNSLQTGAQ